MCNNMITTLVAGECRHKIEELPHVQQYPEAEAQGAHCNDIKDVYLGQSHSKDYCPDCEAVMKKEAAREEAAEGI